MRLRHVKQRTAVRWSSFKDRNPRFKKVAENFLPGLYLQLPSIGSYFAARSDAEHTWLYLTIGSAMFIPTISIGKKIYNRLRGRGNGATSGLQKFVMADLLCGVPAWIVETTILRLYTDKLTEDYISSIPLTDTVGMISAYLALGTIWYFSNKKYFKKLKERKPTREKPLFDRLKYGFSMGFYQSSLFSLIEQTNPKSKIVKKIGELKEKGEEEQKTYETDVLEDTIEILGVSRGTDWFIFLSRIGIMTGVRAFGFTGKTAFDIYFGISTVLRLVHNSLWATPSTIGVLRPRIDAKDNE